MVKKTISSRIYNIRYHNSSLFVTWKDKLMSSLLFLLWLSNLVFPSCKGIKIECSKFWAWKKQNYSKCLNCPVSETLLESQCNTLFESHESQLQIELNFTTDLTDAWYCKNEILQLLIWLFRLKTCNVKKKVFICY